MAPSLSYYGTLGPACAAPPILRRMFRAGMTGLRLNLSHGLLSNCGEWLSLAREAARAEEKPFELLIDLQGAELRVGDLPSPLTLGEGRSVFLGDEGVPLPAAVLRSLVPGQEILLDDGALSLRVEECASSIARCTVVRGGVLQSRKSIALPGLSLSLPPLAEADRDNLRQAEAAGVTGVMLPFVRDGEGLLALRAELRALGLSGLRVFAKIESKEGLAALPELLPHADEIVVARGDLGNALTLPLLPGAQKDIAALCRQTGKPFMIATQLLHSMEFSAVPTRAEVSDIFNAVLDGASSLMLTGETAVGRYPAEAMEYLVLTGEEARKRLP